VFWRSFNVKYSCSSSHPLSIPIGDSSATTVIVSVIKDSINNVSNGFKTSVWMPWGALWFARCVFNFAHLIEVDEGIEVGEVYSCECTTNWEAFAFITLRRRGDALDAAGASVGLRNDARQDGDIGNGYGGHLFLFW
jgi:hypothetical protein